MVEICVCVENVGEIMLLMMLVKDGVCVVIVEYLLLVMVGFGIDNCFVEFSVVEVLIMDGFVGLFVFLFQFVGIVEQEVVKCFICIKWEVIIEEDDKKVIFLLFEGFKVSFGIDFDYLVFKGWVQIVIVDFFSILFVKEVSCVWIFGFMCDIEKLWVMNLVLGGSVDNVIVVDDYKIFNEDGLWYDDEFVKYKVLDVIGDLYLFGNSFIGEFCGIKFGYDLNNKLLCKFRVEEDVWEVVIFDDEVIVLIFYMKFVLVVQV